MNWPLPFTPFEYMHWAKMVPPGAAYPMHVSGLPAPAPAPWTAAFSSDEALTPIGEARAALAERLLPYLGGQGLSLMPVTGASEGLFVTLAALVGRGTGVVVEELGYSAFERVVTFLRGAPVMLERDERDGWRFNTEKLAWLLRRQEIPVVAITDPHNPTGAACDPADRAEVVRLVERAGAILIVDETFAGFRPSGPAPLWAASSPSVLSIGSLTKAWGLGALRCGWLAGAADLIERCEAVYDLLGVNAPSISLRLAAAAFDHAAALDSRARAATGAFGAAARLTDWGACRLVPPATGITGLLRLPNGMGAETAAGLLRREHDIQTVPGHFFGMDGTLRIGGAAENCDLLTGCRLIARTLTAWADK